jgi:hypothetical protein
MIETIVFPVNLLTSGGAMATYAWSSADLISSRVTLVCACDLPSQKAFRAERRIFQVSPSKKAV